MNNKDQLTEDAVGDEFAAMILNESANGEFVEVDDQELDNLLEEMLMEAQANGKALQ